MRRLLTSSGLAWLAGLAIVLAWGSALAFDSDQAGSLRAGAGSKYRLPAAQADGPAAPGLDDKSKEAAARPLNPGPLKAIAHYDAHPNRRLGTYLEVVGWREKSRLGSRELWQEGEEEDSGVLPPANLSEAALMAAGAGAEYSLGPGWSLGVGYRLWWLMAEGGVDDELDRPGALFDSFLSPASAETRLGVTYRFGLW